MTNFDPDKEVAELKKDSELRRKRRKRSYSQRKSKLDKYHAEMEGLRQKGSTIAEITRWLSKRKRFVVAESTVHRWLKSKDIHGKI